MPKCIFKRVNCKFRFPTALEANTNSWSASLPPGTSPPEFPLKWQGRGLRGMGWVEKQRSRMWRKWEFRYRETFFFSVFLIQTKRKTWRIRALNMCPCWTPPLRRTALRSWKIRSGWVCLTFTLFAQVTVGKVDTDRAQQNGVIWDSCPGNSYYSWSFQRLWNRFMFNVDETRNALNSLIRPSI